MVAAEDVTIIQAIGEITGDGITIATIIATTIATIIAIITADVTITLVQITGLVLLQKFLFVK